MSLAYGVGELTTVLVSHTEVDGSIFVMSAQLVPGPLGDLSQFYWERASRILKQEPHVNGPGFPLSRE